MKAHVLGGLSAAVIAITASAPAEGQSFLDKLKEKAKDAVEEAADKAARGLKKSAPENEETGKSDPAGQEAVDAAGAGAAGLDPSAPPPDGRWQGRLSPKGKTSLMGYGSMDIVLSEDVDVLRYAHAATRCLAELKGEAGRYDVAFVTGQSACGRSGKLTLGADGTATFEWIDAPNTPADEKLYAGTLQHSIKAWPQTWSASTEQRGRMDAVGFTLGMSYEQALAHMKAEHDDLKNELRMIVDPGSTSIVQHLTRKNKKLPAHEITLLFEAQTPAEMEVEQDPAVLARREEVKQMQAERSKKLRDLRRARFSRRRDGQNPDRSPRAEDLPPLPEMPSLRPRGADAELLVIHRKVAFPRNQRPHEQNVMQALIEKYGQPSARKDVGPQRKIQWAFDPDGNRISDASQGPCDHVWKAPGRLEGLVPYYGSKAVFASVSPRCGLTVKAEMRYEDSDRGVYQLSLTMYDQQRLLGDEWTKIRLFSDAYLAEEKAELAATKSVTAPDL